MILMGVIGKIGVLFASIPAPIIGGMYMVMFGIVTAVGISNLRVGIKVLNIDNHVTLKLVIHVSH